MAKNKVRKTERLRITPWTDEQLQEALYEAETAAEKRKYSEMLSGTRLYPDERLWYTKWEIALKKGGTVIGELQFQGRPNAFGETVLSYELVPAYRGKGYGLEAMREMLNLAFRTDDVYFVQAEARDEMSRNLLLKLDFVDTGGCSEKGCIYERERPASEKTKDLASLGAALGLMLGFFPLGNLNAGILIGVFSGYAIGAYFDGKDRRIRENLRRKRR